MAALPTLLRTVLVADMPDDDWPAAQTSPGAANLTSVAGVRTVGVSFIARASNGDVVNPSGTVDLQPVVVAASVAVPNKGVPSRTLITGGAVDDNVAAGVGLTYTTLGAPSLTVRVADDGGNLGGTVASIDIYWNAID